ncbi:MAG: hypothetical protein NVS9B5_11220 [Terriglobales bacterium]
MRQRGMLIDRSCSLRAAIAPFSLEIERCHSMFASCASEHDAIFDPLRNVMSHIFILVSFTHQLPIVVRSKDIDRLAKA